MLGDYAQRIILGIEEYPPDLLVDNGAGGLAVVFDTVLVGGHLHVVELAGHTYFSHDGVSDVVGLHQIFLGRGGCVLQKELLRAPAS